MEDFTPGQVIAPQYSSMWVSPNGKCYFVPECGHVMTAIAMGRDDEAMENEGWLHFSVCNSTINGVYMGSRARGYTQAQMDVLYDVLYTLKDNDRERVRYEMYIQKFTTRYTLV